MSKIIDKDTLRSLRETWPEVNTSNMSEEKAVTYKTRKQAVDLYIDGVPISNIIKCTGLRNSRIWQLVEKAISINLETGETYGYSALLPAFRVKHKPSKMEEFLNAHHTIKEKIVGVYFGDRAYTLERCTNIRTLHGVFVDECKRAGIQENQFPFNRNDYGYEALRRFFVSLSSNDAKNAIKREGKDQRQQFLSTGYGKSINIIPRAPFDIVQIDGHKIDITYVVTTETANGEVITEVAERIWLIAVIDVATHCIIGYSVSPHENYNQFDVLAAIRNSIMPHVHKEFALRSLKYPSNGGFPSEVIPEAKWACPNTIMLDNAKSHLADNVVSKLTSKYGCVLNYGSVATPETRGIVERFFGTIERSGFHRMPNTTGSNPRDKKRQDSEKQAKKLNVRYEDICEILEYLIAEYNNSAHSALNGLTPLQMMERRINDDGMPIYTIPFNERQSVLDLCNFTVTRVLRGGYECGKQLHINYEGAVYHAYDKAIPMSMKGETVQIEINPNDLREVKMYRNDGSFFCNLIAMGEYGRVRHSLKTRKMSNKAKNERMTADSIFNPNIAKLNEELVERGKKSRRSRTKAATIAREAEGALDPKEPAEVIHAFPARAVTSRESLPKAVSKNARKSKDMSLEEINQIFEKYSGNAALAVQEINEIMKRRSS